MNTVIFAPCIVYGEGEGFGNKISIQTVAIVKAALALKRVYSVDDGRPVWPVCHVIDNTTLYLEILKSLEGGYYLASPGSVAWMDIYEAMSRALAKRGLVEDGVERATAEVQEEMGRALGCSADLVPVQLGGSCSFLARHGKKIGWKPHYPAEHILEAADDEVELILKQLK